MAHITPRPARRPRATLGMLVTLVVATLMTIASPAVAGEHAEVRSEESTRLAEVRSEESTRIDDWITDRMAAHGTPGVAVAVVRDGKTVHLAGYGSADPAGRAVTPDTPFVIGSSSKPFTAMVVRQLVDQGLLALDEPVLPHIAHLVDTVPDGFEDVTVGQLLTHTGGLSMAVGLAGTVELHDGDDALDRRVVEVLAEPMAGDPDGSFEYSNAGAMILASVTEQITGRPFADTLHEQVFDPLGMTSSFASDRDPRARDVATGHRQWFGLWRPSDLPYDNAGVAMGYVGSSARDLATFLQAHLDGHDAVPATADQIADESVVPTGWDEPLEGGYGFGWFVDELADQPIVSHSGTLGHFTAHLLVAPESDLGVVVLSNSSAFVANGHEGQYDLSLGLTQLLLGQGPSPTDPSPVMTVAVPVLVWAMAVAIAHAAIRSILRARQRRQEQASADRRRLRPGVISGAVYVTVGTALLVFAPLDSAREFYPDAGWGATVVAHLAIASGLLRLATTLRVVGRRPSVRSTGATSQPDLVVQAT